MRLSDLYLKIPIVWDLLFSIGVTYTLSEICSKWGMCVNPGSANLLSLLNELVSSSIAICGFVLAALTIVLTMRQNIGKKSLEDAKSGLELLLTGRNYRSIFQVFFWVSIVFIVAFFYFICLILFNTHLDEKWLFYLIAFGISVSILSLLRCVFILKQIIGLQIKENEESSSKKR